MWRMAICLNAKSGQNYQMNQKLLLGTALVALNFSVMARAVRPWSKAELENASDLIVLARPMATNDLDETSSLGWSSTPTFQVKFRGVETTFRVLDVLKGMPENDKIILHHYRMVPEWGSPPNGPSFIEFTPGGTNQFILYLTKDGTNRYAPVTGQIDAWFSIQHPPTNRFGPGFPMLAPIAEADPTVRHPVQVHVPVRLHATRHGDSITIKTDELALTNLTVGTNMVTGTQCEIKVYQGDKLLDTGGGSLQGGLADGGCANTLWLAPEERPKANESLTVFITITMFETDEPSQHFWSPHAGKKYKVLSRQDFKLTVK